MEYNVAEPYDDRRMQDVQQGYAPPSPYQRQQYISQAELDAQRQRRQAQNEKDAQAFANQVRKSKQDAERWNQFATSMIGSKKSNPEDEAHINDLAEKLGTTPDMVRANRSSAEHEYMMQQLQKAHENSPAVAQFLSDPNNAKVAHDDVSVLGALGQAVDVAGSMIRGFGAGLFEGSVGTAAGTVSAYGRVAPVAAEMEQMSMNPEAISGGEYMQRMEDMTQEGAKSTVTLASDAVYKWSKETADSVAGDASQNYGWFARGMVSGARSMGSMLPGMAISTLTMNPSAALISGGLSEGSQAFMEDIDKGRGLGTALTHAWWNGGTEVLTELIPVGGFLSDVAKKTPFWKSLLKNWARETPSELAATALQTGGDFIAEAAGDDIGGFLSGSMDSKKYAETMTQYLKHLPEAELETVIAVLPMSFGMSALGSIRRVRAANDMQQALKTLHENGDASKLRGRALDNYRQFIEVSKQGTPIENAYIDAKDFVEYFQSQEIDPKQAAQDFGIKNYDEAVMSNGKLEMPFENYMADFAASGHAQSLIETTTLNENIPSLKDSIVYEERIRNSLERVDRLMDEVDADRETMDGAFESINRVAQEYQRHLEAVGYTPETAATQATVAARLHVMPIVRDVEARAAAEGREATADEIAKAVADRLNRYDLRIDRVSGRQFKVPRNLNTRLDPLLATLRAGNGPSARQVYGPSLTQAVMARGGLKPTDDLKRRVKEGRIPRRLLSKNGLDADVLAEDSLMSGYMTQLDLEHMQSDDALIEALEAEHSMGQMTYDGGNLNEDLLGQAVVLNALAADLGRAGIDLNEVTDDAEVRRLLAEFDGERYGEQGTDSGTVPETEEAGAGYEGLDAETLYQFIGEKGAAALDRAQEASARMDNLGVAREMESAGKDAKAIKLATGWERGADGKWRYEVMDIEGVPDMTYMPPDGIPLFNVLTPELVAAYPALADIRYVERVIDDPSVQGYFSPETNSIVVNLLAIDKVNTVVHEVQHAIQRIEGFEGGANNALARQYIESRTAPLNDAIRETLGWMDDLAEKAGWKAHLEKSREAMRSGKFSRKQVQEMFDRDAFMAKSEYADEYADLEKGLEQAKAELQAVPWRTQDVYARVGGEVEARNVMSRRGMSFAERRASLASETEDVARKDQIFLKDGVEGGMAAEQEARENIATAEEKLRRDAEAFGREVDKVFANDRVPSSNIRMLSQTPLVMQMVASDATSVKAAAKGGVWVSPHTFSNALSALGHPGMTADVLKQIPEALANPIAIFDSDSQQNHQAGDLVFMVGVQDTNGATVVLPVALNVRGGLVNINIIKSAYGKESNGIPNNQWFISQANRNARYVNGQMFGDWLRHNGLSRSAGVQFPFVRTTNSNGHSVYNEADLAKLKGENTTLYQSVPAASDRLMAVHNLSGDNLVFADEMGGLAVPSIGVVGQEQGEVAGFGEITLIGTKDLGAPERNPVFSSDAYTARFPEPEYKKVPVAKREALDGIFGEYDRLFTERLVSKLDNTIDGQMPDRDRFERYLHTSLVAKLTFLKSIGIDVPMAEKEIRRSRIKSTEDLEALRPFVEAVDFDLDEREGRETPAFKALAEKFAEVMDKQRGDSRVLQKLHEKNRQLDWMQALWLLNDIENIGRTELDVATIGDSTETALREHSSEFWKWCRDLADETFGEPYLRKGGRLVPYTLGNIVDVMTSSKVKGEEQTIGYGFGQMRADASLKFEDLEVMREHARKMVVDDAAYKKAREETEQKLKGFEKAVEPYNKVTYNFYAAAESVAEFATRKRKTKAAFKTVLKKNGLDADAMSDAVIRQGMEAADALMKAPVPYFESKPQRAVSLDEFAGAVIPKNTPQNVRDILAKHGIQTFEYDGDNRTDVVRQAAADLNSERTQTLFQKEGINRGAFQILPGRRFRIEMMEKANFSTFAHECAHFQLEMLSDMVSEEGVSDYLKQEYQTICDYIGGDIRTLTGDARTDAHERFARSFEAYLMEGKAPSPELRTVFQRFKDWMVRIYQMLRNLDVNLNPDIREVFDRMLASDAEIAQARDDEGVRETLMTAEDLGLSEQETKALRRLYDRQIGEAQDKLRAKYMKQFVRRRQKQYQEEFKRAEKQAEKEYEDSSLVYVGRLLTSQEDRALALNEAELVKRFGKDYLKQLPKFEGRNIYAPEGETFIDELAEANGFESSDELLQALENLPTKKEWIARRAQEIADTFFGDIVNAAEVSDEVNDAMNNDPKGERLKAEMQVLAKAVKAAEAGRKAQQAEDREAVRDARREAEEIRKDVRAQYDAMERVARQTVAEKLVKDIRPHLYLNAMHKAMRESLAALNRAKPDYAAAARLKQKEMMNFHLYRAARDAHKALDNGQKKMRDYANRKMENLPKQRNIAMVYKAKYIAGSLLGRDVSKLVDRIATEEKYSGADPFVYDIGEMKSLSYGDAMKAMADAQDYWDQSLRDNKILAMGKLVDIETAGGEMSEALKAFGPSSRAHNRRDTIKDKFQKAVGNFITSMTRMESWCDMVDGRNVGQETGAWKKYIFNPIKEAAQNARVEQKQYIHELGDILKEFNFTRQTIKVDELGGFVFGEDTGYAKMEIAHAFLHCGNRSNFQRLIVGHGWGTMLEDGTVDGSRWSRAVQTMIDKGIWTEADMDRVQRIWDLMDKLKPKLQEAYKTVNGKYFDEIQAEPVTMFGKEYAGGYVPAIYDPYKSKVGQKQEVKAEDILNTSGSFLAKLSDGFGVTRVQGVPGQLVLDLSKIGSHFNQQVLFANMAPVAADVGKLLRSKGVQEALMEYDPTFYQDVIVPWFSRAVTQNVHNGLPRKDAEERLLQKIRSRAGIATMFMNITNAIEGFFDLTATFSKVDGKHLRNAFMQMVTDRKATVEKILEMSAYMRERMDDNQNAAMEKLEQALHPNRLKVIDNWINDHAYFAQEMIDGFTGPVGFLGAYNQAIEAGLSHAEAVSQAESVVRSVHGTMMPEDLANRETGTVWKRLFTQFTGYFVQRANTVAAQHSKITREGAARQKAALTMLYLQTVFLPAWIGAALRKAAAGSDDDETFGQWLLDVFGFGTASYVIGLFGATIPGQGASAALEIAQGNKMAQGRMFSSPATQLVANIVNPRRWFDSDGNIQWSNALRNLASWANIVPVVPVVPNRPVASAKYLIETAEGKVKPTGVWDFVRGTVTGRASKDSK